MAESTDNIVTFGMRGLVGRLLVFRQFFGKTIVAKRPKKTDIPFTADQQEVQSRFAEAATYAKTAIQDPGVKSAYEAAAKPGQTAYNIAFADYFKAPTLSLPDISGYTGQAGEVIGIRAKDNFLVSSVQVAIEKPDGTPVESGDAVITENGQDWTYSTTMVNDTPSGSKVRFTATDLPGNSTSLEVAVI